jgi:hypothetical protein
MVRRRRALSVVKRGAIPVRAGCVAPCRMRRANRGMEGDRCRPSVEWRRPEVDLESLQAT